MYPTIQLKAGREAATGFRHPWIFSGAIATIPPDLESGALVHVSDRQGRIIGTGTYSKQSSIAVRVFDFKEAIINQAWLTTAIQAAHNRRLLMGYGLDTETTGYRVVFSEADNLPGLIIDRYSDVIVLQISTAGMDALRPLVITACQELFKPRAIVEKSDLTIRKEEALRPIEAVQQGALNAPVEFKEHGLTYLADVINGQKTGFFLDQKDLRTAVKNLAKDKTILNLFSYTGATSIAALQGGATHVQNVDMSPEALELVQQQAKLNNFSTDQFSTKVADVFQWLNTHQEPSYDLVILDPPALTKSKKDSESAQQAYHFLNRAALRLVKPGGFFVTSSCSHFFSEDDMLFTLRRASVQAGATLHVLQSLRQSADHPLSVYFPESHYLKSYICQVEK